MQTVKGLWVSGKGRDDKLPPLAALCAKSFLDNGFAFELYTYEPLCNIPSGVQVCDASTIIPERDVYRTLERDSLCNFSDWFRCELLYKHGGIWSDMDNVCLKHKQVPDIYTVQNDPTERKACLGVASALKGSPMMQMLARVSDPGYELPWYTYELCELCKEIREEFPDIKERRIHGRWGLLNPDVVQRTCNYYGVRAYPSDEAYPIPYGAFNMLYDSGGKRLMESTLFENAWCVHMYGEMCRKFPKVGNNRCADSVLSILAHKHAVSVEGALS
ncbi:MAG: glycosyltransferase [Tannerellaceae bacterium]